MLPYLLAHLHNPGTKDQTRTKGTAQTAKVQRIQPGAASIPCYACKP